MKWAVRIVVFLLVISALAFMFYRSVQSTRSAAYTIASSHLQNWTGAIEPANAPNAPLIALRPPREMASTLFRQLFTRLAESFNGPTVPVVPLLLQEEFDRSFAGQVTSSDLLAAAREAGLEAGAFTPRCMGYRRASAPGVTRQVYYVVFEAPAFVRFRQQLAARARPDTGYDAAALSPVMLVAASDADFHRWLPIRVDGEADCVAPVVAVD